MTSHADAALYGAGGFERRFLRQPTLPERQALCGVGRLETRYGDGWKNAGVGSNNIGAIQAAHPPCDPSTMFQYTDTHPNPDGTSTAYSICFRKYARPEDGWADLVRVMYGTRDNPKRALAEATRGNLYGVSAAMRAQGFYEGFGKTQSDRINNHYKALYASVLAAATALGEPMPDGKPTAMQKIARVFGNIFNAPKKPTLRRGSRGEAVKDWQRFIGVVADGIFGPITEQETIVWQGAHKNVVTGKPLKVDGVVGTETWAAAEVEARALPEAA